MKTTRIDSIDLLRGVVMIIMALDHCRDYFHLGAMNYDPTDMETTTPALFLTRFVTHYCAPIFIFLAGTSAFLYGQRKTPRQLSRFLFTRGLWLIFLELFVNNLIWWFDIHYEFINLQVLWAIGFSMISLSVLIFLPDKILLLVGVIIVAGHNLLDGIVMEGDSLQAIIWYFLHQQNGVPVNESRYLFFNYPVLAWIGVIVLGYCFGNLYRSDFHQAIRKKWLLQWGAGAIALFLIFRFLNVYVDLHAWEPQRNVVYTSLSFFNVTKYPPSLAYLLITIGPGMLFLYVMEHAKGKVVDVILTFGRVPFFYYLLHILFIHLTAMLLLVITGGDWRLMILDNEVFNSGAINEYGYSLWVVYAVWICIVLLLYPLCYRYMKYKAANKDKWWLSYL